jgi:hypothetical protein
MAGPHQLQACLLHHPPPGRMDGHGLRGYALMGAGTLFVSLIWSPAVGEEAIESGVRLRERLKFDEITVARVRHQVQAMTRLARISASRPLSGIGGGQG